MSLLLIKNGTIRTMAADAGKPFRGDILCEGGKIGRIAEHILLPESADVQVIDAVGCLVLPGFIDAHCHVGISEEKTGPAGDDCNENTQAVLPWLRALDAVSMADAAFLDARRAGITSLLTGPGSTDVVGGQAVFLKTKGRCVEDAVVLAPAAMKIAFGENPKMNFSEKGKSPATRMAIAGLLRQELFRARKYCRESDIAAGPRADGAEEARDGGGRKAADGRGAKAADFALEAWRPVFAGKIPLKAHVHRADDIATAIRIAKEFGLGMTLDHCTEGYLIADKIAQSGFPAIVGPLLTCRNKLELQNMDFQNPKILHQAGVLTAICSDHPVTLIGALAIYAGLAVKAGLPMEAGLEMLTCNPAKICRVYDRVGSLEVGKDADLAVFSGNPMEVSTQVRATVIDGEIVYRG